jgi:hypothetical protein
MVSTITSFTVATMASAAQAGAVALVGMLVLLVLLIQKEIASTQQGAQYRAWSKALNVAIPSLMVAFILVVLVQVAEILR